MSNEPKFYDPMLDSAASSVEESKVIGYADERSVHAEQSSVSQDQARAVEAKSLGEKLFDAVASTYGRSSELKWKKQPAHDKAQYEAAATAFAESLLADHTTRGEEAAKWKGQFDISERVLAEHERTIAALTEENERLRGLQDEHARQAREILILTAENHQLRSDSEWVDSQRHQLFDHALTQENRACEAEAKLSESEAREGALRAAAQQVETELATSGWGRAARCTAILRAALTLQGKG